MADGHKIPTRREKEKKIKTKHKSHVQKHIRTSKKWIRRRFIPVSLFPRSFGIFRILPLTAKFDCRIETEWFIIPVGKYRHLKRGGKHAWMPKKELNLRQSCLQLFSKIWPRKCAEFGQGHLILRISLPRANHFCLNVFREIKVLLLNKFVRILKSNIELRGRK